jgi:hypothetical protein
MLFKSALDREEFEWVRAKAILGIHGDLIQLAVLCQFEDIKQSRARLNTRLAVNQFFLPVVYFGELIAPLVDESPLDFSELHSRLFAGIVSPVDGANVCGKAYSLSSHRQTSSLTVPRFGCL